MFSSHVVLQRRRGQQCQRSGNVDLQWRVTKLPLGWIIVRNVLQLLPGVDAGFD